MSKHTPGPWVHIEIDDEFDIRPGLNSGRCVATVRTGARVYTVEANARLIAAAPELLEALKDFVLDHDNGLGPSVDRLRAAIAKAEGRES